MARGPNELLGARTQFCRKWPAAAERFQDWGLILLTFASACAQGHGSSASRHLLSLILAFLAGVKWYLIVGLICVSLVKGLFMLPIGHLYIFFEETSSQNLCPFFNWIICLFIMELFRYTFLIRCDLQIFPAILWVAFLLSCWCPSNHESF